MSGQVQGFSVWKALANVILTGLVFAGQLLALLWQGMQVLRTKRFWFGLLTRSAMIGLTLWLGCWAMIDYYGQQDQAQPADAIVVLGAKVYPGARLGPSLTRRTQHAVTLYQRGLASYLVCSGGLGEYPPAEGVAACALAGQLGIPPSAVLVEDQAHSTEESAANVAALMHARGWTRAIVVSDGYHVFRVALLFRQAGLTVYPSPAQTTAGAMGLLERIVRENREVVALFWYGGKTLLGIGWTQTPF